MWQQNSCRDCGCRRGTVIDTLSYTLSLSDAISQRDSVCDTVGIGQRFGLIRFGSRVDVYLPVGQSALVSIGQRMVAGETVLADLDSNEPEREARRS